MSRAIPLVAVLCTGIALGALIVAVIGANRADPSLIEEVAPLDAAAAVPEIAQLRESRGSVLAGTSLGITGDAAEFSAALSHQAGAGTPQPPAEKLVELLRLSASQCEEHARQLEAAEKYDEADQLRRLAEESRRVARGVGGNGTAQASREEYSFTFDRN
jgi:hypothetical protein